MKRFKAAALLLALPFLLTACSTAATEQKISDAVDVVLSDEQITVNGESAGTEPGQAVYTANDIIYYESGKDFTYGEGTEADAHSAEDADAHTVVHITEPGTYRLSGTLSRGQVAVDLGEDAKDDPDAVVTLLLDNADITCEVAPAVIFYSVYECGSTNPDTASKEADTSAAGANVILADGSENNVTGSYVARIYKPDSVVLNEDGTEVETAKKLHKYDGAFYSKMSMNIDGEKEGTGVLNIYAENEGLDSELHLTVNGGNINIRSGNDGINTNEDGVSVTAVNGGNLSIVVTGETGEGDGIDSNGWLVINGGSVSASACSLSADAGIDSDLGIHITGGSVLAAGSMLDRIEEDGQSYAVFSFAERQNGKEALTLKDESGKTAAEFSPENDYSILIYSSPDLKPGSYTLWSGEQPLGFSGSGAGGFADPGVMPGGTLDPEMIPDGVEPPETWEDSVRPPEGEFPSGESVPPAGEFPFGEGEFPFGEGGFSFEEGEFSELPDFSGGGMPGGERPNGGQRPNMEFDPSRGDTADTLSSEFSLTEGANYFNGVTFLK